MLDLEFLRPIPAASTNVPRQADSAICQAHARNALAFPPVTAPIDLSQSGNLANARSGREGLDVRNLTENFESHARIVSRQSR
jgi:hypothetical protein